MPGMLVCQPLRQLLTHMAIVPPRQSAPYVDVAAVSPLNIVSGPTPTRPGTSPGRHRFIALTSGEQLTRPRRSRHHLVPPRYAVPGDTRGPTKRPSNSVPLDRVLCIDIAFSAPPSGEEYGKGVGANGLSNPGAPSFPWAVRALFQEALQLPMLSSHRPHRPHAVVWPKHADSRPGSEVTGGERYCRCVWTY